MSAPNWPTILSLLLLAVASCSRALNVSNAKNGHFQPIFQTEETVRQQKSRLMHRHMNLSADPCADFYEYACGKWKAETTLEERIDAQLLRLLDEPAQREDTAMTRQAKDFYKSCVSAQAHQSQQQQQFLSEFIQQHGGFPAVPGSNWEVHQQHSYDWVRVLGQLRRQYGMDILIGLRISYNYANVHENSIYLDEPSMLLPRQLCAQKRLNTSELAYETLEQLVAEQLKAWLALANDQAQRVAEQILRFEFELCGSQQQQQQQQQEQEQQLLQYDELLLYQSNYTRKTLAEFSQLYGQPLDFNDYVTASCGQVIYKPVYMAAPHYYRQLLRSVSVHNTSQLANYIMYRALDALTFPHNEQPQRRPGHCLGHMKRLLPAALGELYARQQASEQARKELLLLYDQLQASMRLSLQADWLEEGTRRVGERKLSDLLLQFSAYEQPTSSSHSLQLERNNYWHNLRRLLAARQQQQLERLFEGSLPRPGDPVEAYETRMRYRPVQRRIDLGWALLQPPDYDARYGHALSYASIGTRLAQQLATGFDEVHWSLALLERDNWDGITAWAYHNRSACFRRQVAHYLQPNASAVQQLIGASAALNVAFRAYLTWLSFQEPHNEFAQLSKETLPGLNFSNTALFFVAYAQQHCAAKEQRAQLQLHRYSVRQEHSWTRLAVNGPLRNSAEFAREFHCAPGAPMNPADKCVIY